MHAPTFFGGIIVNKIISISDQPGPSCQSSSEEIPAICADIVTPSETITTADIKNTPKRNYPSASPSLKTAIGKYYCLINK